VYLRALELEFNAASAKRPDLPTTMSASGLLNLYHTQGRFREIELIYRRLLETKERLLGPRHADVAFTMVMLAQAYAEHQKYFEARPLFERAIAIQEKNMGPDHPGLIGALSYYAATLRKSKEDELAAGIEARIEAIRKKSQRQNPPQ
jgi:tetratricopeptide (TPR) repeat protein